MFTKKKAPTLDERLAGATATKAAALSVFAAAADDLDAATAEAEAVIAEAEARIAALRETSMNADAERQRSRQAAAQIRALFSVALAPEEA